MKHGERIKARILDAGLDLWREKPLVRPSARRVAKAVGMTHQAVLYHFVNVDGMHDALADEAIRVCDPVIVPVLIASGQGA